MRATRFLAGLAALAVLAAPVRANDSEAAVGIGGLVLTRNDAISMDSEDLYISKEEVRVSYRFTNRTSRDIETTVSFPVPSNPANRQALEYDATVPALDQLQFQTTVDGRPVELATVVRAEIAGRDVTARVAQLGWPLDWYQGMPEAPAFIAGLSEAQRAGYLREGLLQRIGDQIWPAWDMVTHITRRQVFPAGRTVAVTHRYRPLIGGSVAGALFPGARSYEGFAEHRARYCIDRSFLAGFDRALAARQARDPVTMNYSETWISYILRSGANWRGPIRDFRLVVDKGRPENLVSFCMNGVRRISPTRFEVRRRNFEPDRDLEILLVEWPNPQD